MPTRPERIVPCHRCGLPVKGWKRADRKPTVRSGLCTDCRDNDHDYLRLAIRNEERRAAVVAGAQPPPPVALAAPTEYDPDTRLWVLGESPQYAEVLGERFDRAAILAERPAIIAARQRALDEAAEVAEAAAKPRHDWTDEQVRAAARARVAAYEVNAIRGRR